MVTKNNQDKLLVANGTQYIYGGESPVANGVQYIPAGEFYGLSSDTKPVGVGNGSKFIEMDTGKLYMYDASEGGDGWIEFGA